MVAANPGRKAVVYLHGFISSPQSRKAAMLGDYLRNCVSGIDYVVPQLHHRPARAIAQVRSACAAYAPGRLTLVGSSLGGFYSTYLAERHDLRAVLINPAVRPHEDLRAYLGTQRNLYTQQQYELTEEHLRQWEKLYLPTLRPQRYLLLVETGDEVLDYREAVEKYRGARQIVIEGGDHSLQSFPGHIPLILEFAGLARA